MMLLFLEILLDLELVQLNFSFDLLFSGPEKPRLDIFVNFEPPLLFL
jgi:hypothetical protein